MCITEEVVDNEVFNNVIITIGLGSGPNNIINDTMLTSMCTELGTNNALVSKIAGQLMNDLLNNKFNL
jgi:hypothetical protein